MPEAVAADLPTAVTPTAVAAAPVAVVAPAAVPAAPALPAPAQGEPAWLPARLEQAQRSLLRELGFASPEEARAAGEAARKAAEASKTAEQRAADAAAQATAEKARAESALSVVAQHAGRQMTTLSPERQAAVKAIAGDDPAKQLGAIDALLPTWQVNAAATPATPVVAAAARTSAAGSAPPPASTSQPDKKATYESLLKTNPMAASQFAMKYSRELFPASTT